MKQLIKKSIKKLIHLFLHIFSFKAGTIAKGAKYILDTAKSVERARRPKKARSRVSARPDINNLCLELSQYDVISFDVFDTLIFRAFPDPKVIFDLWGTKFNLQYGRKMRAEVERELRATKGTFEITLQEIYDRLAVRSGIDKETGMKAEIELELTYCRPNKFLLEVFNRLIKMGKTVIILSDMYLPSNVISEMLTKCGYTGYDALYVSSDYGETKSFGNIYGLITQKYGKDKSYIQIGDNPISDIKNAKLNGWSAYYYESIHKIGKPFRPDGMSSLGGGLYRGIVNSFLYSGGENSDPYYKLGFVHFGIFAYGYCRWLVSLAKEKSADLILFAARDMHIVQKIFNQCFGKTKNKYISISRLAIIRADFKKSSEMFFTCMHDAYAQKADTVITIYQYFSSIDFEFIFPLLEQYELKDEDLLDDRTFLILRQLILENKEFILEQLEKDHCAAKEYYLDTFKEMGDAQTILFADTNGRCTSTLGVQHILDDTGLSVNVIGAQMYSISQKGFVEIKISENTLSTYSFSYLENRNFYERFQKKGLQRTPVIEAVFTEPQGTLRSYVKTEEGQMNFGPPSSNEEILEKIHQGMLDFAKEYHRFASEISSEFWVSPFDAIIPVEQVIDRIPKQFPDLMIDMTLGN